MAFIISFFAFLILALIVVLVVFFAVRRRISISDKMVDHNLALLEKSKDETYRRLKHFSGFSSRDDVAD